MSKIGGSKAPSHRFNEEMNLNPAPPCRWLRSLGLGACATVMLVLSTSPSMAQKNPAPTLADAVDLKDHTISPVANPLHFEDPVIRSEIRPVFVYHNIHPRFLTGGGQAQLYALQIRYAITDRLAFIATQDGYFDVNSAALANPDGWMDLAAGFKYALIDDPANQFILTPGFTYMIPSGDRRIFQGRGGGEFDLFVSAMKGFGDFHLTGNIGFRLPLVSAENSSFFHTSLMADYYLSRWFIPFVQMNTWTVMNAGTNLPGVNSEGYDVINFGSGASQGVTQVTLGGGFRVRLTDNVFLGLAYEKAAAVPYGLFDDRYTFDLSIRF